MFCTQEGLILPHNPISTKNEKHPLKSALFFSQDLLSQTFSSWIWHCKEGTLLLLPVFYQVILFIIHLLRFPPCLSDILVSLSCRVFFWTFSLHCSFPRGYNVLRLAPVLCIIIYYKWLQFLPTLQKKILSPFSKQISHKYQGKQELIASKGETVLFCFRPSDHFQTYNIFLFPTSKICRAHTLLQISRQLAVTFRIVYLRKVKRKLNKGLHIKVEVSVTLEVSVFVDI